MELILEVVNPHVADLSFSTSHRFTEAGGSIGRGESCVWRLPDSSRHLSSQHAHVFTENGQFYIEDISTNGLFVNGADQPLGKGNSHCVRDGDEFRLGPYQVTARLWVDVQPVAELPESIASFFEELETSMPAAGHDELADQLAPRAQTEVEEVWDDESLERELAELSWALDAVEVPGLQVATEAQSEAASSTLHEASPASQEIAVSRVNAETTSDTESVKPLQEVEGQPDTDVIEIVEPLPVKSRVKAPTNGQVTPAMSMSSAEAEAVAAFASNAGLDLRKLSSEELVSIMGDCGSLLRGSLKGMMDLLAMRMEQKNRFRLGLTLIQRRENNPLKYSVNEVQALNQLVVDPQPECLSADQSVQQAVSDLMHHLRAIETAYQELIREIVHFVAGDEGTSEPAARRGWVDRRAQKRSLQKRLATLKDDQILQREFFEHRFSKLYEYAVSGVSTGVGKRS